MLWLCCSSCCAKCPSEGLDFTYFLSNILYMQWDGPGCKGQTGRVAKVSSPSLINNSFHYTCLQSHLKSPGKPTVSIILLAHSSASLLAQQLELLPSLTLTLCPHLLLVNPMSSPINYALNCLKISSSQGASHPIFLVWDRCRKVILFHHQPQHASALIHCSKEKNGRSISFTSLTHPNC